MLPCHRFKHGRDLVTYPVLITTSSSQKSYPQTLSVQIVHLRVPDYGNGSAGSKMQFNLSVCSIFFIIILADDVKLNGIDIKHEGSPVILFPAQDAQCGMGRRHYLRIGIPATVQLIRNGDFDAFLVIGKQSNFLTGLEEDIDTILSLVIYIVGIYRMG